MSALVLEAAEYALIHELGPSIDVFASASTIQDGIVAILAWIGSRRQRAAAAADTRGNPPIAC